MRAALSRAATGLVALPVLALPVAFLVSVFGASPFFESAHLSAWPGDCPGRTTLGERCLPYTEVLILGVPLLAGAVVAYAALRWSDRARRAAVYAAALMWVPGAMLDLATSPRAATLQNQGQVAALSLAAALVLFLLLRAGGSPRAAVPTPRSG